ncbi:putative Eukaryotic initiation factor 4A-I protein, partial [Naja naja]
MRGAEGRNTRANGDHGSGRSPGGCYKEARGGRGQDLFYRMSASQESRSRDNGPDGMDPDGVIESNWNEIVDSFDDMNLSESLLRGIYAYGFEKPSAIQQRAILPCIKGYDVIAQAQSGTGKTATFAISILQQIELDLGRPGLGASPSRELAQQ